MVASGRPVSLYLSQRHATQSAAEMEISLNSRAPHLTYNRKSVTFIFADSTGAVCGQNAPVPAVQAGQKYHFAPVLFYPGYNFNTFSYTKQ